MKAAANSDDGPFQALDRLQPPDGLVFTLVDGSQWCVTLHQCN